MCSAPPDLSQTSRASFEALSSLEEIRYALEVRRLLAAWHDVTSISSSISQRQPTNDALINWRR